MGLFSKLKQAANFVTGGGAKVLVQVGENATLGKPMPVKVTITLKDGDIKARRIYLKIRSTETVIARDVDFARDRDGTIRNLSRGCQKHPSEF